MHFHARPSIVAKWLAQLAHVNFCARLDDWFCPCMRSTGPLRSYLRSGNSCKPHRVGGMSGAMILVLNAA